MNRRTSPKVLLLQLEFPTWVQARAWTYPACFGVGEGLRAAGATCITLPLFANTSLSPDRWLDQTRAAVGGQRFDQVWVWLVHSPLTASILEWISGLAPTRVGIVMESLTYDKADYDWARHLRARMQTVAEQSLVFTHVLVPDERDVESLAQRAHVQSLWWPTMVPERFIVPVTSEPHFPTGVFHGHPYGSRRSWLENDRLLEKMMFVGPGAPSTQFQTWFDHLQASAIERWASPATMTPHQIADYVTMLQEVREGEFREWMAQLPQWAAIVNLPSLAKFYGGRVYEGMAAGRPVLTYHVPDHPLNNSLFVEGEEVLCYAPDDPDSLKACLDRVLHDRALAHRIAANAQHKVRRYHTSERRLADTLRWIESGERPDYGLTQSLELRGERLSISQPVGIDQQTSVFVLTVDDPAFPACMAALDSQQGVSFTLEIIRNVSPFSAAAQKMITDCTTEFFIQVDEDMVLQPDAVATMEAVMRKAPDDVGMICFHLFDDDRELKIQGVKIYRASLMRKVSFQDVKASEMDLLEQMGQLGIKWILHPDVKGRHGTCYTPETIYRRYKTMYEKDIRAWNVLTWDLSRKAEKFRETGNPIQLFALLGAAHGIIEAPHAQDREKDFQKYNLKELEVFKRLLVETPSSTMPYDAKRQPKPLLNQPIPIERVQWKHVEATAVCGSISVSTGELSAGAVATKPDRGKHSPIRPRVLLATPLFWPSIGGVEMIVDHLGVELLAQGYAVDVATIELPHRQSNRHRGMTIISLSTKQTNNGVVLYAMQIHDLVVSGAYQACIIICNPIDIFFYALANAQIPAQTRLLIQPVINKETYDAFVPNPVTKRHLGNLLRSAAAAIELTRTGFDDRLMREVGIEPVYLPNAVEAIPASGDFRKEHGIAEDAFVILHVANLWEVKNHVGLLRELNHLPVGMRLVMIGHATTDQDYSQAVRQELEKRSDVLYIPGACPEKVSAAMEAADVVVLASHAEASPVCILEAMSHRKAWLATPECGAVAEHAGGIVTPLENVSNALALLKEQVDLRQALAQAGYEHWRACYRWNVVIEGWVDLIETGRMRRSFEMPKDLARRMEALTQAVHEALAKGELSRSEHTHKGAMPVMSHLLSDQPESRTPTQEHTDAFYTNLFVKTSHWSTPHPNPDEAARWSKIAAFLEYILRAVRKVDSNKRLRMIEIGCGRGWLTNLASSFYGTCEGVEPVAGVIEHARRLFPHLRFEAGTAETVLARPDFAPYDVVLCSEVIEHIPQSQKAAFVRSLRKLLKLGGHMIMTTPRGELWEEWKKRAMPNQPVEEWLSERELESLLTREELRCVGLDRVYLEMPSLRFIPTPTPAELRAHNFVPIYQVWACEWSGGRPATLPVNRTQTVSVIVPTCNRPDRLREALRSIQTQTYRDFEIVVVNDGTIDIEPVVAEFNREGRITYIRHDRNRGLAASRNTGLRAAKGKYIAYLDDDDRYLPDHLETLVKCLEGGEFKIAYTDAWRVHERKVNGDYVETARDVPYSNDFSPADLLVCNYFPVLCVMHARQCLDEVGCFDESLFAHEDWDLWIRMATKYPFKHLKHTTAEFTWRADGSSMTSSTRDTYVRTTEIIYRKYAPYVERIAGVREAQQRHLKTLLAQTSPKSYVCSIVVPVWNRLDMTRNCLTALSQIKDQPEYEVIVVDNGSTDGTKEFLAEIKGDVQIIRNEQNLGFAKACNQGARAAHGKYLVFLNNDTIPQIGWLSALVSEVDADPAVGIVGSKLLYPDGTIQHAGVVRDWERRIPYHIYKAFAGDHPAVNQRREFQIVTAACLLIRRALFEEVGGFDEAYVNGFEDADLCLKVRERGYLIIYQPRSVVIHLESQTPGRKAQDEANIARFLDRWGAQWWAVDEDLRFYQDGYKLKRIFRNGLLGGDIQPIEDIKERACWAHVAAAQTAALRKDWDAVKCELRLVDEWPDDQYVLSWGAMLAERLEESIWRTRFLSRYLKLGEAPAERLVLVRTLIEQKNLPDAEEQLGILLASSPDHAEGLLVKGVLCMQREQYQEAERAFSSALQQGADRRKCLMGMGMAAFGQVYHQGAWERFLQVLEECPDDAEAIHWLLRAGAGQNRWEELSRHLRKYLSRNPADLSVRFALAGTLVRGEQIEAAYHECDTLRSLAPTYDGLSELGEAISRKQAVSTMEASHS